MRALCLLYDEGAKEDLMMSYRHLEELDSAVRVADRAVSIGRVHSADGLTRYLYQRWYLGTAPTQAGTEAGTEAGGLPARTWHTWSPSWSAATHSLGSDLLRLYLAVRPETAGEVVSLVTARAMSWDEPWRFSSTSARDASATDSTVLYLPISSLGRLRAEVQQLLGRLSPLLRADTPALTLRIGPGAALAQSPADGRSFGEHRCALVARAVLDCPTAQHREQVSRAHRAFAEAGVDPDRPYRERRRNRWDEPWRPY